LGDWTTIPTGPLSTSYGDQAETRAKLSALRASMFGADVDAVYLEGFANVAWLAGGRGNRVVADSPSGLCAVLVGANGAWLLVPNNEEARLRAEVFADLPLPVVMRPWYQLPLWQAARKLDMRREARIDQILSSDSVVCIYGEIDQPTSEVKLVNQTPIEQHWEFVRAVVELKKE